MGQTTGTMANGLKVNAMGLVYDGMNQELCMKECGKIIFKVVKVVWHGTIMM